MKTAAGISDEAVKKATGCTWDRWFRCLDSAGGREMSHKQIVGAVGKVAPKLDGWWQQMVTVGYEQARGLRQKNQSCDGVFQVSASKTVGVPLAALYSAWADAKARRRWLREDGLTVRKATANKSLRITWAGGATSVEVNFYAKGDDKSQVTLQHRKLSGAEAVPTTKAFWTDALDRLKRHLEGGK